MQCQSVKLTEGKRTPAPENLREDGVSGAGENCCWRSNIPISFDEFFALRFPGGKDEEQGGSRFRGSRFKVEIVVASLRNL